MNDDIDQTEDIDQSDDSTAVDAPDETTEDTPRKGNDEAAKWRVKFREAETSNAALTARVAALQASEVTRMATGPGKLVDGSDLLSSVDLDHLLDDQGEIDEQKVTDAIDELIERKPHLGKPVFAGDVGQGQRGDSGGSVSWHDVIAG